MTERIITIGEDIHIFRRAGLKEFEHFLRPRWSKSARGETRVNGPISEEEMTIWIKRHTGDRPITLDEERAALEGIGQALDQNPLRIFKEKEKQQ